VKYGFSLTGEVVEELLKCSRRDAHCLVTAFRAIAAAPDSAMVEFHGPDGRLYAESRSGHWIITHWLDFPIREVRIVAIRKIQLRRS
jgi:hypothetical protein